MTTEKKLLHSLFDLVDGGTRMVVFSDVDTSTIYTWNKSQTLQAWVVYNNEFNPFFCWDEIDIMTVSEDPDFLRHKIEQVAKSWHQKRLEEVNGLEKVD